MLEVRVLRFLAEDYILLGYDVASMGNRIPTFRNNVMHPCLSVKMCTFLVVGHLDP
jgi:hypothetical protein